MKAIDLGQEAPDYGNPVSAPTEPEKKTYYPSFYISNCPELSGLQSGKAIIEFNVVSRTEREQDGEESCSLELEVTSIKPEKMPAPEAEGESDAESAFNDYEAEK